MKKIGALYQVAFFALLMLSVIMFSGIAQAATATVDDFVGVPWGADKQQVATTMAQRGFKLIDERELYGNLYLVYQGTFADEPAELVFEIGKNGFKRGTADLLSYDNMMPYFYEKLTRLITAKYGKAYMWGTDTMSKTWQLQTGGPQPAPAEITVACGDSIKIYLPILPNGQSIYQGCYALYSADIVKDSY